MAGKWVDLKSKLKNNKQGLDQGIYSVIKYMLCKNKLYDQGYHKINKYLDVLNLV